MTARQNRNRVQGGRAWIRMGSMAGLPDSQDGATRGLGERVIEAHRLSPKGISEMAVELDVPAEIRSSGAERVEVSAP